jgi:hypothetical protein
MTIFSKLIEEYWKLVHLPRGFMAFDATGNCMMLLFQSEYVRIIVMRKPSASNMYYVEVEIPKSKDILDSGWQVHEAPGVLDELSGNIVNSLAETSDILLDEIT